MVTKFLALLATVLACSAGAPAVAADYPARPLRMLLGYPAGSGIDNVARQVAAGMEKALGQPVVVENKAGALGNLAADFVAKAPPDGYTILFTPNSTHAANVHLFKKLPFDPIKDFMPVGTVASLGFVLLVAPEHTQVGSVEQLTAMLKQHPGRYSWGSGNATGQVAGELYKTLAGVDAVNVPYKGVPPALTDLIGGRITFLFADATLAIPQLKGGRVKALAVTGSTRPTSLPDVPTMAEAGVRGYDLSGWFGIFLPAHAPEPVRKTLSAALAKVTASPELARFLRSIGAEPLPGGPDDLARVVAVDTEKWGKIIRAAGMTAE
ncbi:MAG: tripartite tricarboxylate transporter substrate binding protein [Pigmentiphaga sp.]|uniref:Bug family tripartite tricarboxylate transporter substrate binding protein n=1 Tax=Pigmentiphaga sp. TaxID=1977564 RepID=UPI0029AE81AE|nr:tripartite tricarboxylate transporter substrate binding protein [Pigmentiphaga sp.]MDX3905219.1 tripartite tricarboxylate transporter substrate binding protein [Pigmentiphaga sp.]